MKELNNTFQTLQIKSKYGELNEEKVFKIIGMLDKKYKGNSFYEINCNGIIGNIGSDLKSSQLLSYGIKRLKNNSDFFEKYQNKFNFDMGNLIYMKAMLDYEIREPQNILKNSEILEARNFFNNISPSNDILFLMAKTNDANILEMFGRNLEAIYDYNEVLKHDNNFGMALGNKAIALKYYYNLLPDGNRSTELLFIIAELYKKSIKDERITSIGGLYTKELFEKKLFQINDFIQKNKYSRIDLNSLNPNNEYVKFVLKNDLFLNFHFGLTLCECCSFRDEMFPSLVSKNDDREDIFKYNTYDKKSFYSIKYINQIFENFVTARYLFYRTTIDNIEEIDNITTYTYALDYTKNSVYFGIYKDIYSKLYNILDKIANYIFIYFDLPVKTNDSIYFSSLTKEKFKNLIIDCNNYQLLALYGLALDFQEGHTFSNMRMIRNKITHEFVDIFDINFMAYENELKQYHLSFEELEKNVMKLFKITKSAIFYMTLAINQESEKITKEFPTGISLISTQNQIYKK